MKNIELPYFGKIDIDHLEEYISAKAEFDGYFIDLDLNFENQSIGEEKAEVIKEFLANLLGFDIQNRISIKKDFGVEGEAFEYVNFYFDELDEAELNGIMDCDVENDSSKEQLLDKLRLIRVGLYPDHIGYSAVFDYTIMIEGEPCNQLLVAKTDIMGQVDHIAWES